MCLVFRVWIKSVLDVQGACQVCKVFSRQAECVRCSGCRLGVQGAG